MRVDASELESGVHGGHSDDHHFSQHDARDGGLLVSQRARIYVPIPKKCL